MTRKLLTVLATLSLASFALAACGDDATSTDTTSDATSTAETSTETDSTEAAGGSGGGGGSIEVDADPGGGLSYTTGDLTTTAGEVTIEFYNDSATPHNVQISGDAGTVGGTDTISSDETTATVDLEPGEYTYFCSVSGHQAAGMEGALTVK